MKAEPQSIQMEIKIPPAQIARLTKSAQELGYKDLKDFLESEIGKALFALSLPQEEQWHLRNLKTT